jgi:hypothetical protein
MSEMSFEDAVNALSEASSTPEPGQAPAQEAPPATSPAAPSEVTPATNQPEAAEAQPEAESFTGLDPNSLPDEVKPFYRSMQADYTRKLQEEVGPWRQFKDSGIDPESAYQAVEFIRALETDPGFVQAVHTRLSEALQAQGLTPAAADAAAAQQITQEVEGAAGAGDANWEDPEVRALKDEVNELRTWREGFEEERQAYAMAAEIQRAEMAIRQTNPDYTDEDMARVFEIAFAHGGDLITAEQSYRQMRDAVLTGYLNSKGSAAASAPPIVEGASHASIPAEGFGEDIEAAHKAALAHLLQQVSDQ